MRVVHFLGKVCACLSRSWPVRNSIDKQRAAQASSAAGAMWPPAEWVPTAPCSLFPLMLGSGARRRRSARRGSAARLSTTQTGLPLISALFACRKRRKKEKKRKEKERKRRKEKKRSKDKDKKRKSSSKDKKKKRRRSSSSSGSSSSSSGSDSD